MYKSISSTISFVPVVCSASKQLTIYSEIMYLRNSSITCFPVNLFAALYCSINNIKNLPCATIISLRLFFSDVMRWRIAIKFCKCVTEPVFAIIADHFHNLLYFIFRGFDKLQGFLHSKVRDEIAYADTIHI